MASEQHDPRKACVLAQRNARRCRPRFWKKRISVQAEPKATRCSLLIPTADSWGRDVGFYDRTQPFSFDLWIYAASVYENSQVLNHRDDDNSGGAGYKLNLEKNHLSFYMMHSWPYNMLHVISRAADSGEAVDPCFDDLRRLQPRRRNQALCQRHSRPKSTSSTINLTESILAARLIAAAFNEFVGLEFGRRFREVTLKDGGIDELRFFNKALTPLEVELSARTARGRGKTAALSRELTELIVANDPRVLETGKALYDAREAQNQIVSWQAGSHGDGAIRRSRGRRMC